MQVEPDGSWTIVLSRRDPGVPNWVSTADRRRGLVWMSVSAAGRRCVIRLADSV